MSPSSSRRDTVLTIVHPSFLLWVIQFPFILVHPRKLRPIFLAKGIILPIVALGYVE